MNLCLNTYCSSAFHGWLRCSAYREVGFITGLNIVIRIACGNKADGKVKEAFDNSKGRDGARRIQAELADNGDHHDVKTIASSMKRQSLVAKANVQRTVITGYQSLPTC